VLRTSLSGRAVPSGISSTGIYGNGGWHCTAVKRLSKLGDRMVAQAHSAWVGRAGWYMARCVCMQTSSYVG
jgi:hypothetical protein